MSFRQTCRALARLHAANQQQTIHHLRQMHILRTQYMTEFLNPSMTYSQKRYIFWNDKKQEGGAEQQGEQKEQKENKDTSSESDAENATKKQQQKSEQSETKQEQKTTKNESQSKEKTSEKSLQEQFEELINGSAPETRGKLRTVWSKLQKERDVALAQATKSKEEVTALEKAVKDWHGKVEILRKAVEEEISDKDLMRKRFSKEVDQAKIYAITKFAQDLIDVPDNLGRALDAAKDLKGTGNNLYDGVESTNHILMKVLEKHGIKQLNPKGLKFDPNYHEALFDVPDPNARPGTVGFVAATGYQIYDRVLKPAKVGVIKGDYVETAEEKAEREAKEKANKKA